MRHVVRCVTCTWTSITGPCCPSTRDSTTNRWNFSTQRPRRNDSNPRIRPSRRGHAARHRGSPQASPVRQKSPHPAPRSTAMARRRAESRHGTGLTGANLKKTSAPKADTSDSYAIHHPRHNAYATYYPTHDSSATHSTNPSNQSHGSATTTLCNHVREKASTFKPRRRLNAMPATSTISPTPSEPCADTKSNASVSLG